MTGEHLITIAAFSMIALTCVAWACCIIAKDADTRLNSLRDQKQGRLDRAADAGGYITHHDNGDAL